MNDAGGVDVLDSFEDGADKARSIAVMDVRREDTVIFMLTPRSSSLLHIFYQRARHQCRDRSRGRGCVRSGWVKSAIYYQRVIGMTHLEIIM